MRLSVFITYCNLEFPSCPTNLHFGLLYNTAVFCLDHFYELKIIPGVTAVKWHVQI